MKVNPDPGFRKYVEKVYMMIPEIESTHKRYEEFTNGEELKTEYFSVELETPGNYISEKKVELEA